MENYQQNNVQSNIKSSMQGNIPNNANYQTVNKDKKTVMILIVIEYSIMSFGLLMAFSIIPNIKFSMENPWNSNIYTSTLRGTILEIIPQVTNSLTCFIINPLIMTLICSANLRKIGIKGDKKAICIILTLVPTLCTILLLAIPVIYRNGY